MVRTNDRVKTNRQPFLGATGQNQPVADPKRLLAMLLAALLVLSCSLFQPRAQPVETDDGSTAGVDGAEEAAPTQVSEPTQSSEPPRVCEDPLPEEIPLGQPVTGSISEANFLDCYWVQVPDGLTEVAFEVTGLQGDLSLAVGYGFLNTVQFHFGEFWDSYQPDAADEIITIANPKGGPYFLKVQQGGFDSESTYQLTVSTLPEQSAPVTGQSLPDQHSCGGPAWQLGLGDSASGQIEARQERPLDRAYYCVEIPEGTDTAVFTVELSAGSVDIFLRHQRSAEWYDRDRSDNLREIVVEAPAPGAYYLDVEASSTGQGAEFVVQVSAE